MSKFAFQKQNKNKTICDPIEIIVNNPKKCGLQIFVLGQSGTIHDLFKYEESTNELNPIYSNYGIAAGVVMQLSERNNEKMHIIFINCLIYKNLTKDVDHLLFL